MVIQVTQQDIENGVRVKSDQCPVALAVKRATEIPHVTVGFDIYCYDDDGREVFVYPLPSEVLEFVLDFDRGDPVSPFNFELPFNGERNGYSEQRDLVLV